MENNREYTPLKPFVQHVEYENGEQVPYRRVWDATNYLLHHEAQFSLGGNGLSRSEIRLDPTPMTLSEMYFPDSLVDHFVTKTNSYARSRLPPSQLEPVTRAEMLRFIAFYYYMGLVRLPNRRDYWRQDDLWPLHQPALTITRARFEYIWRNLHLVGGQGSLDEEVDLDEEAEMDMEAMEQLEPEDFQTEDVLEQPEEDMVETKDTRWYNKCAVFLDHVATTSRKICIKPGSRMSIDEMMKRFKGRSGQTTRMKGKPIKEGYKFWALCDALTGFVYEFFPDGCMEKQTIYDTVMALARALPISSIDKYVIAMDNYFTWQKVVSGLTQLRIGCVGTSRPERNWPPKEIKSIEDTRYNTLYTMNDKGGFLTCRWIDNNVVTMVTNVHKGDESVERARKRPRKTNTNRRHLEEVWGQRAVVDVHIPKIIDDYNHWMLGVDKADQFIAYYRPNLRCRRVWMPLLFHGFDVARVNSYIAASHLGWKSKIRGGISNGAHKEFITGYVKAFLARATTFETRQSRRLSKESETPSPPFKRKRVRLSTKNPQLPDHRFWGDAADHIKTEAPSQA